MAVPFSRIVLAFDESLASRVALEYACALARRGAMLTVAYAVNEAVTVASATTANGFAALDPAPLIKAVDERGAAVLKAGLAACATLGVAAEDVFLRDAPTAGIVEFARERNIDLVVVGTHGREGVRRALLGSVAEGILHASTIPLLVVTAHAVAPRSDSVFERALVAIDDSDPAREAMRTAAQLSTGLGTHLTVCNVIDSRDLQSKAATYGYDPNPFESNMHAAALKLLREAAEPDGTSLTADDLVVVEGEPAAAIEHAANQRNCDLIVLGSHGRRGIARLFLGSVAESVVRKSSRPVLVVPPRASHR
jgi:nucleotide-binding universal stress UspA family protein